MHDGLEQNVKKALLASYRGYVLELGKVALAAAPTRLIGDDRGGAPIRWATRA